MRDKIYSLDINKKMYQKPIFKQNDNNIPFNIRLIENGLDLDLREYTIVEFFLTPGREVFQKNCIVENSIVKTLLTSNVLKNVGIVKCEIVLYKNDEIQSTLPIEFEVVKSIDRSSISIDEPMWEIIKDILEIPIAEKGRVEAEEKREESELKRQQSIKDLETNINDKVNSKFVEVDNTLEEKTDTFNVEIKNNIDAKFTEINTSLTDKMQVFKEEIDTLKKETPQQELIDARIAIDNEIKENLNERLIHDFSQKANVAHKHNASDIEGLTIVANAEDINYTNIKNEEIANSKQALDVLFTDTETSKKSILDIENLVEAENIKCSTDTGEYTIENSRKGYTTNLDMQGKTLVNLWGNNISDFSLWKTTFSDNKINVATENGIMYHNFFTTNCAMYKPNTLYTIIVYVYKNTLPSAGNIHIHTAGEEKSVFGTSVENCKIQGGEVGTFKFKLTTINNISDCNIVLRSIAVNDASIAGHEVSLNMTILEGDYTNTNIEYFKGLQSVGQNKNIELLTFRNGEVNLFDKNGNFKDNYILQYSNGEEIVSGTNNHKYTLDYIDVESNIEYTFYSCSRNICWYDENKTFIPASLNERIIGDKDIFYVARSPKDAKYLRVTIIKDLHKNANKTIITKGNKYDKKTIPYILRSLPNGIRDEIVYKNNKYYLIKRCEEVVLDGDNFNPQTRADQNNNTVLYVRTDPIPDAKPLEGVLSRINTICCDRFKSVNTTWGNEITTEGIIIDQSKTISFRILRSKLETQDIEGVKKWMKSNPIKVVYELEIAQEIELGTLNLEQYDNQTRFICDAGSITSNISFESTQNLGSHIEVIRDNIKNINSIQSKNVIIDLSLLIENQKQQDSLLVDNAYRIALLELNTNTEL
ncbi:hypothetical protein Q3304_18705 [Clostridioides sp. GD02377]|uniref:hypothetical protein n=1 Tax=unclassified Clostridioides TaxID=2635829 RepID=UPI0038AAE3CD